MIVLKIGSALISSDKNLSDKLIKSITGQINNFIKKKMRYLLSVNKNKNFYKVPIKLS